MSNGVQGSAWEILVIRRVFAFPFRSRDFKFEIVCPPVAMIGSTAGALYDALYCHPQQAAYVALADACAKHSHFTCRWRVVDGARSVKKLAEYEGGVVAPAHEAFEYYACGVHRSHLTQGALVIVMGVDIVSALYNSALFMRVGGFFLRVILGIRVLVQGSAFMQQPATEADIDLSRQLLRVGEVSQNDADRNRVAETREQFRGVLNGGLSSWFNKPVFLHYCSASACCGNYDHAVFPPEHPRIVFGTIWIAARQ